MSKDFIERLGHALGQRREQIDAEAHIAGLDDHRAFGGVLDPGVVGRAQPGRADDVDLAGLGRERGEGNGRGRRGEIDDAVGLRQQRRRHRRSA